MITSSRQRSSHTVCHGVQGGGGVAWLAKILLLLLSMLKRLGKPCANVANVINLTATSTRMGMGPRPRRDTPDGTRPAQNNSWLRSGLQTTRSIELSINCVGCIAVFFSLLGNLYTERY
jgi:hypothetical protein